MRDEYFAGERLYGDDFTPDQIERWFADEADAYVDMTGEGVNECGYMEWATRYGFRHLPRRRWRHVLGFGSARGEELTPIASFADRITILESSARYEPHPALPAGVKYIMAEPSGDIALPEQSVDLLVCFGVLHHIPNVTHVVREWSRICTGDAWCIVREPITSMGDWTQSRAGLTPHERGIPLPILRRIFEEAGFVVRQEKLIGFAPVSWVWRHWTAPYNSPFWTAVDKAAATVLRPNLRYHATKRWQKFRPTSVALVLRRDQ
jgi:SAM-dependent methyltransferase